MINGHAFDWDLTDGLDVQMLRRALQDGPITVGMHSYHDAFFYYKEGILTDEDCDADGQIDHAVVVTGYGYDVEEDMDYFIIANSWSTLWGDNGFAKIQVPVSGISKSACQLTTYFSFPLLVVPTYT